MLIVTDLEPQQADELLSSERNSIECSYRDIKSDGWQWHKTRLISPERAERLWLAIAVATLWTLTVGSQPDGAHPKSLNEQLPPYNPPKQQTQALKTTSRHISCFLQGLLTILADLLNGKGICLNGLFPFPRTLSQPIAVNSS